MRQPRVAAIVRRKQNGREELYDLREDPVEKTNLLSDSEEGINEIAESLRRELLILDRGLPRGDVDPSTRKKAAPSRKTVEQLRSLGYVH